MPAGEIAPMSTQSFIKELIETSHLKGTLDWGAFQARFNPIYTAADRVEDKTALLATLFAFKQAFLRAALSANTNVNLEEFNSVFRNYYCSLLFVDSLSKGEQIDLQIFRPTVAREIRAGRLPIDDGFVTLAVKGYNSLNERIIKLNAVNSSINDGLETLDFGPFEKWNSFRRLFSLEFLCESAKQERSLILDILFAVSEAVVNNEIASTSSSTQEKFKKAFEEYYLLLLLSEAIVDFDIDDRTFKSLITREVRLGRLSANHWMVNIAVDNVSQVSDIKHLIKNIRNQPDNRKAAKRKRMFGLFRRG